MPDCKNCTEVRSGEVSCIHFGNPDRTDGVSKFDIREPGHYCLTEDMHARFEFADHPAEQTLISIFASNVVLDLQGYTLGRGRIFKNRGGFGISVDPRYSDVRIRNGTLQDFEVGVFHDAPTYPASEEIPVHDAQTDTYCFRKARITLENITFKNNKQDFNIRVQNKAQPDDPEQERRRKSKYPPCGGTDDFGRPMSKDQPCNDGK